MNERLSIQDLIDALASKHNMPRKDAEVFVREFFLLIEQALESEQFVKVKGLGTFKLVNVESRESVSVNTGERFEIKGHTKLSFIPDAGLRDTINKPFSHFETVVLNEHTVLEDTIVEETTEMESEEEVLEEEAIAPIVEEVLPDTIAEPETADVAVDEPAPPAVMEDVAEAVESAEIEVSEFIDASEVAGNAVVEDEPAPAKEQEPAVEPVIETVSPQMVVAPKEEVVPIEEKIIAEATEKVEVAQPNHTEFAPVKEAEKNYIGYLVALIVGVLLLCGGAVAYSYYLDTLPFQLNQEESTYVEDEQEEPADEWVADSLSLSASEENQSETNASDKVASEEIAPEASQPSLPISSQQTKQASQVKQSSQWVESQTVQKEAPKVEKTSPKQSSKRENATQPKQVYSESAVYEIVGTKTKHTVKAGETLMRVSLRYYGTKAMWTYIVKHNPKVIKNPDNVPYGTVIAIPELKQK